MISVSKIFFVLLFVWILTTNLFAQDSFADQFNLAKNLYEEEKYFDAVTEFKRLLFFYEGDNYSYESNLLIGLSYKEGAKFSEAIQHFTLAELNSKNIDEVFIARLEIIKANILRRTTARALTILDSLLNDSRFASKIDEINYWRGWTYIFSDDWENASLSFSAIQQPAYSLHPSENHQEHFLRRRCRIQDAQFLTPAPWTEPFSHMA